MKIIKITEYHHDFLAAINHLLPQLSPGAQPVSEISLRKMIDSDSVHLLMAVSNNQPVGMLSLVLFSTPTGNRARIEDLVVDADMRRKGVGSVLTQNAITLAFKIRCRTIDLTSHPLREAANALYRKWDLKSERPTRIATTNPIPRRLFKHMDYIVIQMPGLDIRNFRSRELRHDARFAIRHAGVANKGNKGS